MANSQIEAMKKDLHPQAVKLARDLVNEFAISLLLQAKTIAHQRGADVVISTHISEAMDILRSEQKQSWSREVLIILGSAFLGAFLPGFITELSTGRTVLLIAYTAMGFLGLLMVFWGLRR